LVRGASTAAAGASGPASSNEIGHLTGKQTIAEWAENAEIIEVLRGLGVDYAQGYGVSQPQKVQRAAIA
jgi:EAL domain-containing protein (putative c-di-GMP-specific phosphodiesterase class I)